MTDPVRRQYVTTSQGQAHLRRQGDGEPIVLLHHAPASSACWQQLLWPLAQRGWTALAVDLPGFGESDPLGTATDLHGYAHWLAEVLDGLGVDAAVPVFGRHSGAAVAASLAGSASHRVSRLILWGLPWMSRETLTILAEERTPSLEELLSPSYGYLALMRQLDPLAADDTYLRARLAELLRAGPRQHELHNAVGRADYPQLLDALSQPALLVCDADRPDLAEMRAASTHAAQRLAGSELQLIPGLGVSLTAATAVHLAELISGQR